MIDALPTADRIRFGTIVENACEHLRLGIGLIDRPELVNDLNAPVLSLLSFGTEHLLKATWIAARSLRTGELPPEKDLRAFGHRVLAVHDRVIEEAELLTPDRAAPSLCSPDRAISWRDEDVQWMKNSQDLRSLLLALHDYGSASGRYHDFTTILNPDDTTITPDPKSTWESALEDIWKQSKGEELERAMAADGSDEYLDVSRHYHEESADLVKRLLTRYFRGIGRWWWCGLLGDTARSFSVNSVAQFVQAPFDEVA